MGIKLELAGRPVASYRPRELVTALTAIKFIRYSLASAVAVTAGQIALWTLVLGLGWDGVPANLGSAAVGAVPNYLINRYWTWQQSGRNRFWSEIVPFWTMAFMGVLLSTLAVAYADQQWDGNALAISLANLFGFGLLWVGRFLILDKVMWKVVHSHLDAEAAGEPGGALLDGTDVGAAPADGDGERGLQARTNGNGHLAGEREPTPAGDAASG